MGSLNTSELDTDLSREMEVKIAVLSISSSRKDTKHLDRNVFEITPKICYCTGRPDIVSNA